VLLRIKEAITNCLAVIGAGFLLLMYTPIPRWAAAPLITFPDLSPTDAIVLLSAWSSDDGHLNAPGMRRTLRAAELYKQDVAPWVVVCGRNRSASGRTAVIMADLLRDLGVPSERILIDATTFDTHEAAVRIAALGATRGWRRVTLMTEPKHMPRALSSFRKEGLEALPGGDAAWDLRTSSGLERLASMGSSAHEWLGLVYYWSKGWI